MYTRKATVAASVGLHARPAAVFVRAVNRTGLPITLARDGMAAVDGRSLLAVMSADFEHGVEVEIGVSPCDADTAAIQTAVDELALLLLTDLTDAS
ncbi:Phosphotransferase system, phosphocarrier protein HPr [Arthrobacter sp. PAMC 25486]|uniref:HPr family phosphocarrier protein n=1 Tax=Arthrobacter sp. PAMC 25486 TaxID=1494608 RepID=UPI000535FE01|nr:HPr family phosphocarrier protein [Arthrobacter sp. PAMC 25486]AIY00478.1 Phosphotransferase system, phosphocarrier protein HPr [Arthrobacter sp. PAMC 25486]